MKIDDLLDLLRNRRSMRRFRPEPFPDEYLEKIIEAARWAPSGANGQPWEFIIVKDAKTKNTMAELYLEARQEQYIIEQTRIEELRHAQGVSKPVDLPGFKDAPVLVVVLGDRRTYQASLLAGSFIGGEGGELNSSYLKNISNAIYGIHLAVSALGLSSQWVSVNSEWEQLLKPVLDVPPILIIHAVIPIGYPAYEPPVPYRRSVDELVHFEKYDKSRYRTGEQIVEFLRFIKGKTKSAYAKEKSQ